MLSFGPYQTLERIAAGGMGEVFVAKRTGAGDFEKRVALKVLLPHLAHDREFVERFFDEARLVARMNHPNIVQIFDVGETDGRPWLAMALVESVSLAALEKALMARNESMPLPLVRLVATGLLEGLAYAHSLLGPKGQPLNVVHRDITPSNLLVSSSGAVLLTDFGIAKAAINLHRTQPGRLRGKLAYVAPETLLGGVVDQRSDIFSAGVTLFQLLTSVSPFLKATDAETVEAVKAARAPTVQTLRPDVGPQMAKALHRALERSPSGRFATARDFREAFCDGPVASAPELGEFVRARAGKGFTAFKEVSSGPSTTSLEPLTDRATQPLSRAIGAAAAVAVLVLAAAGWFLFMQTQTPPADSAHSSQPEWVVTSQTGEPPGPASDGPALGSRPEPDNQAPPEAPAPEVRVGEGGTQAPPTGKPSAERAETKVPRKKGSERSGVRVTPPSVDPLKVGFLTADASPWADVSMDGKPLDRTPLSRFPVPVGSHLLLFRSADGRTLEQQIEIEVGALKVVQVRFPEL